MTLKNIESKWQIARKKMGLYILVVLLVETVVRQSFDSGTTVTHAPHDMKT